MDEQHQRRMEVLETKVAVLETRVAVAENNIESINKKLDKIESNTTWLIRLVIGAVILAVLGFVITQKPALTGAMDLIKGVL